MAREIKVSQNYGDKLLKLIPSEIIAAYMIIMGIIPNEHIKWGASIVAIILFILTPFYLVKLQKVKKMVQIIFTTLSFAVWVYSLGGPFKAWGLYQAWLGSTILILWTLFIPLIVPSKNKK